MPSARNSPVTGRIQRRSHLSGASRTGLHHCAGAGTAGMACSVARPLSRTVVTTVAVVVTTGA